MLDRGVHCCLIETPELDVRCNSRGDIIVVERDVASVGYGEQAGVDDGRRQISGQIVERHDGV